MNDSIDARETSPPAERNKQHILDVLTRVLPSKGLVLEIGSGTGQHVAHFAKALPALEFQPTEMNVERHASIIAWTKGLANVRAPIALDVTQDPWPVRTASAIVAINVIHYSPWATTLALMSAAAEVLAPGGVLVTYGPYKREGKHTAPSNEAFDAWLKERDKRFGVRDMGDVAAVAMDAGLEPVDVVEMPANNFVLVFRRG